MIVVIFNKPDFEYDVHSLLKEFFPQEDVQMYYSCPPEEVSGRNLACTHHEMSGDGKKEFADAGQVFRIDYVGDQITIKWEYQSVFHETWINVDPADRKETKNQLKIVLYKMIEKGIGHGLPWGTLSGIRPTKIAMKCLEDGMNDEQTYDYLKENYLASDEKINLSMEIAKREKALLDRLDYEKGYSLYVGIPFCPSTCAYCSFTSYPLGVWKNRVDEYLDALEKELSYVADTFKDKTLNSVYIGGGTPTTLLPYQLDRLIKKIKGSFDLSNCLEFTVEAGRPDSITREKLETLKANGISRISVNPQTMKQKTLDIIGRHHTVEDTINSFKLARETGFDNINMDIILGLPGEVEDDVTNTIEEIKKLNPDSLTVHSLAIKRASKLNQWIEENGIKTLHNTDSTMDIAQKGALELGMKPYYLYRQKNMSGNFENVGYAREGKYGIYNILIMEEVQTIVALGAGSITKRVFPDGRIERCDNVKDVALYIEKIDEMIERKRKLLGMEP